MWQPRTPSHADGITEPRGTDSRRPTWWRRLLPAVALLLLAPVCAEYTGRGWPTMLLLGLGFGIVQAGLIDHRLRRGEAASRHVHPAAKPGAPARTS